MKGLQRWVILAVFSPVAVLLIVATSAIFAAGMIIAGLSSYALLFRDLPGPSQKRRQER